MHCGDGGEEMKAITFLGAAKAWDTTYVMPDGKEYTAPFFGAAMAHFYPDLSMKVFVTEKARQMHLTDFQRLTEDFVADLDPIDIPDGATEPELWTLFQTVVDSVDGDEQVIFDITHGFRSLPFLSFLAAAYLRTVKNVAVEALLYGNFEARDQSVEPHRAPVIDLTPFVGLLDWMIAADRFVRFGDAQDLAQQLRKARPDYQTQQINPDLREQAVRLSLAAKSLDSVSLALHLIRPDEAMDASAKLVRQLVDATQSIQVHARPFAPLAQSITDAFAPLAVPAEQQRSTPLQLLAYERRMVDWFLVRKQYAQALAVAREWVVSWIMCHLGMMDFVDSIQRQEVERAVGQLINEQRNNRGAFGDVTLANGKSLRSIRQIAQALDIYSQLG